MDKPLFSEFKDTSKSDWLRQLEQDLKGKTLDDLAWKINEDLQMDAFYHPDDFEGRSSFPTMTGRRSNNRWEIGEYVEAGDVKAANKTLLEGLLGGVQAPALRLKHELSDDELHQLLEGVDPRLVSLHFEQDFPGKDPEHLLYSFGRWVVSQGISTDAVAGSIGFDPFLDWPEPPFTALGRAIAFCASELPGFRVLQIDGRVFHDRPQNAADELALILAKGSECFSQMETLGFSPSTVNRHMYLAIAVNTSYFIAIAKIRALKIVWANLMAAYGMGEKPLPHIAVHLAPESQGHDPYQNMITATTQAMSAVIGGVDRLYLLPSDASIQQESSAFSRRIARNVQHLLQLESFLDRVSDPAAGSYYIETLTEKIAQNAWKAFQQMELEGGFKQG